jgi:hypothetical protein
MRIIGLRCSNNDFAYALIEGAKQSPAVTDVGATRFPKGYEEPAIFHWFHQEMVGLLKKYNPDGLAVKAAEPMVKRSAVLETRIRAEGIALMAAAEAGVGTIQRRVKSTIAKNLGMKGRGKYLETKLDTSPISDFDSYSPKQKEAILVGWSCLE